MKKTVALGVAMGLAAIANVPAQSQDQTTHKLTKLWESEATLKVPEGVRLDSKRKVLYVSNIDGQPWEADGKGSIAKVGLDGKVIAAEWVTGLDCPKGLALSADGKVLYAADAGGIVVIDVKKGKIKKSASLKESSSTISSPMAWHAVCPTPRAEGLRVKAARLRVPRKTVLKGPNGLLVHGGTVRARQQHPNHVQPDKTLGCRWQLGGVDGLENVKGSDFIVSVWTADLVREPMDLRTDVRWQGCKPAPPTSAGTRTMTVYVPTFFKNSIIAFKVE
jgi:hypothetical protein